MISKIKEWFAHRANIQFKSGADFARHLHEKGRTIEDIINVAYPFQDDFDQGMISIFDKDELAREIMRLRA